MKKLVFSATFILVGSSMVLAYSGGPFTASTSAGSATVSQSWNWDDNVPSFDVTWTKNNNYTWTANNQGNVTKICYQSWWQLGGICSDNEVFVPNFGLGPVQISYDDEQNRFFNENADYTVKVKSFGRKAPSNWLESVFNPNTWFDRWHLLGRVVAQTDDILACEEKMTWWEQPAPKPHWDGANCFVTEISAKFGDPFTLPNGNYYVPFFSPNTCQIGVSDLANCVIGQAPAGMTAFVLQTQDGWALYYGN